MGAFWGQNNVFWRFIYVLVKLLLFLEYCTSRADPDLARSEYLHTIGKDLHEDIDILWTGISEFNKSAFRFANSVCVYY